MGQLVKLKHPWMRTSAKFGGEMLANVKLEIQSVMNSKTQFIYLHVTQKNNFHGIVSIEHLNKSFSPMRNSPDEI